jgi:hypothetical protein
MLRRVILVRTDVSEDFSASFIKVTRTGAPGTTLAATDARYVGCHLQIALFLLFTLKYSLSCKRSPLKW